MKRLRAAGAVWLSITVCVMVAVWAARVIQPPRQELASVGITPDSTDIVLIDTARTLTINLTHSAGDESFPAWSPDGQRLIFYSFRNQRTDLYAMNLDDGNIKRLAASGGPAAPPAWSGDGQSRRVESAAYRRPGPIRSARSA